MKTIPIYILLIIFFLNFDLAWGSSPVENDYMDDCDMKPILAKVDYLSIIYSANNSNGEIFHSLNIALFLNSNQYVKAFRNKDIAPVHRLRLNIGLSKVLTEIDYDFGFDLRVLRSIDIMPFIILGTNIYSIGYGGGIDINIPTTSRFVIVGNLNFRTTEKLFGHTDSQQWYQSGFGAKLGITAAIR